MKKQFIAAAISITVLVGAIVAPENISASVTSGVSSALGTELQKNIKASVSTMELPVLSVGENSVTEASEPETETETATETESLMTSTEALAEEETESAGKETARAGVTLDLNQVLTGEMATNETPDAVAEESEEGASEEEAPVEETVTPICGYTNIGICNIQEGNLNIRTAPGEDAELAGKLPKDAGCEIINEAEGWSQISSGEVEGYVKSEYLLSGDAARARAEELKTLTATVTADVLNVREEPSTDCEVTDQMATGEEIPVIEELGEWIKVDVDGEERYIKGEFVTIGETLKDALTLTEARYGEGVSDVRIAVVEYATQFVGNPYVWGGTSLTNGADCSGFVLSIMANYGVYLPHSSAAQANCGTRVSADELQPGDLIFYGSGKRIGHVAIYIGNGQICHASNKRTGITISNMYYRSPICCTRVL